ncbi:hypothetical protein [Dankookia sp. P2]|uniref:hypothetical protein n=1 Tax=Dankookia sp. P2 TaxID=3423955 RepID=UPI003D664C12
MSGDQRSSLQESSSNRWVICMVQLKTNKLAMTALLCVVAAAPASAGPGNSDFGHAGGNGIGSGGRGAPGPLAGAGLPFLLIAGAAGAYKMVRRRRDESRQERGQTEQL